MLDFVDVVLYEFRGQLSLNDIYHMTYKEIGYLRRHRHEILKEKAKNPGIGDALEAMTY